MTRLSLPNIARHSTRNAAFTSRLRIPLLFHKRRMNPITTRRKETSKHNRLKTIIDGDLFSFLEKKTRKTLHESGNGVENE